MKYAKQDKSILNCRQKKKKAAELEPQFHISSFKYSSPIFIYFDK